MIKIGILNADNPGSGELLRLLINHPEADIVTLYAPMMTGRSVGSVHHGFIGENLVNFTDKINPEELDILFISEQNEISEYVYNNLDKWPELKIIDFSGNNKEAFKNATTEIGLSETNRKSIVRNMNVAHIPTPELIPILITLFPLATYMLINSDITISLSIPSRILKEGNVSMNNSEILTEAIKSCQPSFASSVSLSFEENKEETRVITMHAIIDCALTIEEIERIYEQIYDDHNFTFVVHSPITSKEVEGTQKCVISLNKPSSAKLELTTICDGRMRGGAGDAVHILNLFKGLHEKTGLTLKSSSFDSKTSSQSSSWFA